MIANLTSFVVQLVSGWWVVLLLGGLLVGVLYWWSPHVYD